MVRSSHLPLDLQAEIPKQAVRWVILSFSSANYLFDIHICHFKPSSDLDVEPPILVSSENDVFTSSEAEMKEFPLSHKTVEDDTINGADIEGAFEMEKGWNVLQFHPYVFYYLD